MNDFEIKIVKYFSEIGKGRIDLITSIVSSVPLLATFWILVVSLVLVFFPENRNIFLQQVIVVTILHFSISEVFFKYILPRFIQIRVRPYIKYPDIIRPIGYKFSDCSIPSSHMASTVAMLFVLTSMFPILLVPSILLALAMSFSRIHNGMHYPSDIMVGIMLGLTYGIISQRII